MTYSHNVALNIRSGREARGFSQDYMAVMLEICQSSYANMELGKTTLSIDRLIRISQILDMDIHQLIDTGAHHEKKEIMDKIESALPGYPNSKDLYDQLILELKNEIDFLRGLVRERTM
ncbi:MAG TPA: helix-turn-helix domain-containing protein [Saprospiraceae bacterium]|nr:helix-turn-helix domain-containing protein [Saprospiraceae bacterium]